MGDVDCIIFRGSPGSRYGRVRLNNPRREVYAHRLAYEKAYGTIPENMVVRHTCDTPKCINPDHLVLGSQLKNVQDMIARGRQATGERSNSRLTEMAVRVIRRLAGKLTQVEVADIWNIGRSSVGQIQRKERWIHLKSGGEE